TLAVNSDVPSVAGLPATTPEALVDRPAGSAPELTDHAYGATPPAAVARAGAYAKPISPAWNDAAVMASGAAMDDGEGEGSWLGELVAWATGVSGGVRDSGAHANAMSRTAKSASEGRVNTVALPRGSL